jgi:hypothetical protein
MRPSSWRGEDSTNDHRICTRPGLRAHARLTRDRMVEAIRELPDDASVADAIERLVFLAKIEEGLDQLDRGEAVPQDEVKRRLRL